MSWGVGHGLLGHAHDLSVMSRRHQAQGEASGRWQEAEGRSQEAGGGRQEFTFCGGPEVCRGIEVCRKCREAARTVRLNGRQFHSV